MERKSTIIIFSVLYAAFAYCLYNYWTANKYTIIHNKIVLTVLLFFIGLYIILAVFDEIKCKQRKRIVIIGIIITFVLSNTVLSLNALNLYSINRFEDNIPAYSSYLPPNGDLSVILELVEGKTVILANNDSHINKVIAMMNACQFEYSDSLNGEIDEKEAFINMGKMDGMYRVYAPLFGFHYYGEEIPDLNVKPFDAYSTEVIVVEVSSAGGIYVYAP